MKAPPGGRVHSKLMQFDKFNFKKTCFEIAHEYEVLGHVHERDEVGGSEMRWRKKKHIENLRGYNRDHMLIDDKKDCATIIYTDVVTINMIREMMMMTVII